MACIYFLQSEDISCRTTSIGSPNGVLDVEVCLEAVLVFAELFLSEFGYFCLRRAFSLSFHIWVCAVSLYCC